MSTAPEPHIARAPEFVIFTPAAFVHVPDVPALAACPFFICYRYVVILVL